MSDKDKKEAEDRRKREEEKRQAAKQWLKTRDRNRQHDRKDGRKG